MKLPIVLTLLAATVSLADPVRKALPFGDALPVQALQPRIKYPTHDNGTLPLYTQDSGSLPGVGKSVVITTNDEDEDRHHDTDTHQTHWDVSHNPSLPSFLFKPSKRATIDCGTFIMDCSTARGACNNACYYQNCVKGGQTIRYQDYGDDEDTQYDNRVQAGTKLSGGATCRSLPLSQRMYDQYPDWATALPNLQTDEWPMAATVQDDFQSGVIRNTLRCIPGTENGSKSNIPDECIDSSLTVDADAGNQYKDFRLEHGKFKPGGKYATARTCSGVFTGDQTFEVLFDISAMTSLEIDE